MSQFDIDIAVPAASTDSAPAATVVAADPAVAAFAALGLNAALVGAVAREGYTEPTAVQAEAIPAALAGKDLLVSSHTGSGKTAAFLLPSLQRLSDPRTAASKLDRHTRNIARPRMLVLAPTRELALQVQKAAFEFSRAVRAVRTAALVGGTPYGQQLRALRDGADVVVATPGRLADHLTRRSLVLDDVAILVLDEADRMLDMGFIEDIEAIVARTPATRQTMLFSATLEGIVGNLASRMTRSPIRVQIAAPTREEATIEQSQLHADGFAHKGRLLDALLRDATLRQAIVFTSTKQAAEDLSNELVGQGFPAAALHGDMRQQERNRTIHHLREGRLRVVVATDVAARGIDIASVTHVINFDLPRQAEDYVHRIGRTGRAGRSGHAISFVAPTEHRQMKMIERFTGQSVRTQVLPGLEPSVRPALGDTKRPGGRKPGWGGNKGAPPKRWGGGDSRGARAGKGGFGARRP